MTAIRMSLVFAASTLLTAMSPVNAAEQDTVQGIIPWEAAGRVFQVDTRTMLFLGAFTGVMYIESSRGEMHEAFVMCPFNQEIDLESGRTNASGHCEISASGEDVAYAELSCDGEVGSCRGQFTLTDGEGRFAGISGSGGLRVRSPMGALVVDMAAGADIRVASGIAVISDLKYSIP